MTKKLSNRRRKRIAQAQAKIDRKRHNEDLRKAGVLPRIPAATGGLDPSRDGDSRLAFFASSRRGRVR